MAERRRRRSSHDSDEESDASEDLKTVTKDSECESEGPPVEEYESAEEAEVIEPEKKKSLSDNETVEHNEEGGKENIATEVDVVVEDDFSEDSEDSWQEEERQEGDGEESGSIDLKEKVLDDDEDRKNPQYIPKKGVFYEHDNRLEDSHEESERQIKKNRKLWKDDGKWFHDRYRYDEQAPKSKEELISAYGYDIRNEDGPPRAGRRRRYGRGPNKYTRKWDDEDAYRLARGQGLRIRGVRGGRGRGRSHSADSISETSRTPLVPNNEAESVNERTKDSLNNNNTNNNFNSNSNNNNNNINISKEMVKDSFKENLTDSKPVKNELIPPFKVLTPKEIEQFRRGAPQRERRPFNRGRFDRGSYKPRFIPNNIKSIKLEHEFEKLHIGNGDAPNGLMEIKNEPVVAEKKNFEKNTLQVDKGIRKEIRASSENLNMGDRRTTPPQVRHNVTANRPKRYSSQRQRAMTETPSYQGHILEAPQYFDPGYQSSVYGDPPSPSPPSAAQTQQYSNYSMPYQDAYSLRPIANPPRFFSPVTIATAQPVIPAPVIPAPFIAAGGGIINYATPHFPQYPIQQFPSPPPPQSQPQEVYRGGVMYFSTQNQQANPVWTPPRRPKAAIPIVPPPEECKKSKEEVKETSNSSSNPGQEQNTEVIVES